MNQCNKVQTFRCLKNVKFVKLLGFELGEKFPNNNCMLKDGTFFQINEIISDKQITGKNFLQISNLIKQNINSNKVNIKIAKILSSDISDSYILMPLLYEVNF